MLDNEKLPFYTVIYVKGNDEDSNSSEKVTESRDRWKPVLVSVE